MNVKNVWEDLLQTLSVTQRAMLKASEPVAASPKGIVVAFDYEIVCARATDDEEMQLAFNNNLSRLMVTNEHSQENPVVDEAIAMFGEELVEVLDD